MNKENQFNQTKYIREWDKKNMKLAGSRYKAEFVNRVYDPLKSAGCTPIFS